MRQATAGRDPALGEARAWRLLAAAAWHHGIDGLLLLDIEQDALEEISSGLLRLIEAARGTEVRQVELASHQDEDDLWGRWIGLGAPWERAGLLGRGDEAAWRLVLVRDLAALERVTARAVIQVLGHPIVRYERFGQSRVFRPRVFWLAATDSREIGRVSRHLIDRFALRLSFGVNAEYDRVAALQSWAKRELEGIEEESRGEAFVSELCAALRKSGPWPTLSEELCSAAATALGKLSGQGARRDLGALRLAVGLARLEGAQAVERVHLAEALGCLGLDLSPVPRGQPAGRLEDEERNEDATGRPDAASTPEPPDPSGEIHQGEAADAGGAEPKTMGEKAVALDEKMVEAASLDVSGAYPEEGAARQVEHAALRASVGTATQQSPVEERGPIIGVRRADRADDLAVLPTILAAIPYRKIRVKNLRKREIVIDDDVVPMAPVDLRAWRREPVPSDLVAILLDATALGPADWWASLAPFLRGAYQRRSAVAVVLVGASPTDGIKIALEDELRAEVIRARSALVPEIYDGLARPAGRATPLAHGLMLARELMATALHHGRSTVAAVRFVVVSDGRGNVPLAASLGGALVPRVGRTGVHDALEQAHAIAAEKRVSSVLIDPGSMWGDRHARALAAALDAELEIATPALAAGSRTNAG